MTAQCPEEDDPIEQDWSDLQAALEAASPEDEHETHRTTRQPIRPAVHTGRHDSAEDKQGPSVPCSIFNTGNHIAHRAQCMGQ